VKIVIGVHHVSFRRLCVFHGASVADRSVDHRRCICPREALAAVSRTTDRPTAKVRQLLRAAALLCLQPRPTCCVHLKCCHTSSIAALIVGSFHARLPAWALVYTLSILCLGLSALARLGRSHSVLAFSDFQAVPVSGYIHRPLVRYCKQYGQSRW